MKGATSERRPKGVTVIGLGRMGSAAAHALAANGPVVGWDVRPVEVPGVERRDTLEAATAGADVIMAFLPSAADTRAIVEDPGFRRAFNGSGAVFVDASTSAPEQIRSIAAGLGEAASRVLDAPILGRPDTAGGWTIPAGGEPAAFEAAYPTLGALATRVYHAGPLGSGHTIKLLNNMMFAAINVITAEAIGACGWLGVDPAKFVEIVGGSAAATVSPLFKALAPRMLGQDLETVFTVALLEKDLRLAVEMCEAAGAPLVSAPALRGVTREALARNLGEEDSSALVKLFRRPVKPMFTEGKAAGGHS